MKAIDRDKAEMTNNDWRMNVEDLSQVAEELHHVRCPLCRGDHDLPVTRYNAEGKGLPHPYFSHFCFCPITGDPFGVVLRVENGEQLDPRVMNWLARAQASGRYMAAIWWLEGDRVFGEWMTEKFPSDDVAPAFQRALGEWQTKSGGPKVRKLQSVELPPKQPMFDLTKAVEQESEFDPEKDE